MSTTNGSWGRAAALAAIVMGVLAGTHAHAAAASAARPEGTHVSSMANGFALELYRQIAAGAPHDNVFFSPWSVYTALAMTAEGARGETAEQMGRVLHLPASLHRAGARPWDFAPVHAGLGTLAHALTGGATTDPALRARADALRHQLDEANAAVKHAEEKSDYGAASREERHASDLAAQLNAALAHVDRYELNVANALWADQHYPLAPEFVRTLGAHYGTGTARAVDWRHDHEGARGRVNAWVAEQTAQRIQNLLPQGSVDETTRLVLTNAIWFKGQWREPFDAAATEEAAFRLAGGGTAQAPLMHDVNGSARYAAFRADGTLFPTPAEIDEATSNDPANTTLYPGAGGWQVVELPYKGGDLAMTIVLPHGPGGLAALETKLDAAKLAQWLSRPAARRTEVFLPKFKLELGATLNRPLIALGMPRAFVDPGRGPGAEFGGMTTSTDPRDALYIGAVLHKAFLDVNEKGTEAAAATAVVMMRATAAMPRHTIPFVPIVRADRPFLFLIRDTASGAILFMGRYEKP